MPRAARTLRSLALCLLASIAPCAAQDTPAPAEDSSAALGTAVLGGVIGAGVMGGGAYLLGSMTTAHCRYDDCDVGGGAGFLLGSWMGGAIGAFTGARKGGGTASFGRALLGSTVGILVGGVVSMSMAQMMDGAGPDAAYAVGYAVVQGAVAGVISSGALPMRWDPARAARGR